MLFRSLAERPINDAASGLLLLIKANASDNLDLEDPKVVNAFEKIASAASTLAGIPLAGPLADYKLLRGAVGANKDE